MWPKNRRSKYNAIKINDPVHGRFDSQKEFRVYLDLLIEKKHVEQNGGKMEIERQVPFMILPKCIDDNGKTIFRERKYIADFFIIKEIPGQIKREYVIDAKGFRTTEYKLKKHMLFTRHGIYIEER